MKRSTFDYSSVKTLGIEDPDTKLRRHGFELEVCVGVGKKSRATMLRLLAARMASHCFKFDGGAFRITVEPIEDLRDEWRKGK